MAVHKIVTPPLHGFLRGNEHGYEARIDSLDYVKHSLGKFNTLHFRSCVDQNPWGIGFAYFVYLQ